MQKLEIIMSGPTRGHITLGFVNKLTNSFKLESFLKNISKLFRTET